MKVSKRNSFVGYVNHTIMEAIDIGGHLLIKNTDTLLLLSTIDSTLCRMQQ